jgi:transcriptional regulator with XRE-family HTH domain
MKMSSKMRILRGPGALRVKLGMSQELFAQYLGIAPSTVSMAELGHRPFPKRALQKLTEMEIALAGKDPEAAGQPLPPVVATTAQQEFIREKKQQIRRLDLDRARFRLQRMTRQYNEIIDNFAHLQLAKQLHGQVQGSQQQRGLERAEMYLKAALRRCNKEQQSKIEGRIAALEILIAAHEPQVQQAQQTVELTTSQSVLPQQAMHLTAGTGTAGFGMMLRDRWGMQLNEKERVEEAA